MSAEVLRRAASLMREVATKAAAQPQTEANVEGVWLNTRFHMTWDPTVALAVADWLEQQAHAIDMGEDDNWPPQNAAIAAARAYLRVDR